VIVGRFKVVCKPSIFNRNYVVYPPRLASDEGKDEPMGRLVSRYVLYEMFWVALIRFQTTFRERLSQRTDLQLASLEHNSLPVM
jgi:hypothetical protein